jgi:hypothetical protein
MELHELSIEATYPWTLEIFEGGVTIDSELHRTREAVEEALEWLSHQGLSGRVVATQVTSLPFVRAIG